jgi:hypothetical protein
VWGDGFYIRENMRLSFWNEFFPCSVRWGDKINEWENNNVSGSRWERKLNSLCVISYWVKNIQKKNSTKANCAGPINYVPSNHTINCDREF